MKRSLKYACMAGSSLILTACLEPQAIPDLPKRPSTDFNIEILASDLLSPWAAEELPGGGYLVTGKLGALWRVKDGVKTSITGLPSEITNIADSGLTKGQGGLLDVALGPDFADSGEIFLTYSYGNMASNGTALLKATLQGDALTNTETIFKAGPPKDAASHFGGRMVVLPDNTLLVTLGDGFSRREDAQKLDTHLGKIVRLTRKGQAGPNNPLSGNADALPEIHSWGHRNVQGAAIDNETGQVWTHEHGPRGGDEINRLSAGNNYGWPIVTYGLDYNGAKISPDQSGEGFEEPVHVWTPSIAPSGLSIYRGDMFPDWNGDALVGGLASGDLRLVDLDKNLSVSETILLSDMKTETDKFRVRDVITARDGAVILVIEDATKGRLLRITPK